MQNSLIDHSEPDVQRGFRLNRLEVYNWGTFHENIWKIEPDGSNSLMTGDIGSGKSTIVDALLTLLVPQQKIVYNKAAGAESRERSLLTYVRGEYKNQRSEITNNSTPVFLRQETDYSVILARFNNKGFESGYTLAQFFWIRNTAVEKFFVISKQDLSIKEHFTLKSNIKDTTSLKKLLKSLNDTEVMDTFSEYSSKFRSYFGIKSEKVLELLYQTVSMKSVGKLTEFMRTHMLEKQDVKGKIDEIKRNYENLTKSHEAVQRAKQQLEQLTPLDKEIKSYQEITEKNKKIRLCIDFLPTYFAHKKIKLLELEITSQTASKGSIDLGITEISQELSENRAQENAVRIALHDNEEGQMILLLESKIESLEQDKKLKLEQRKRYADLCQEFNFLTDPDKEQFIRTQKDATAKQNSIENEVSSLDSQHANAVAEYLGLRKTYEQYSKELDSLTRRKTKIPERNIRIRELILANLSMKESELPFVGELLQIKPDERKKWEGAIERVLHNFGLSLLVADRDYKRVSSFVDNYNLKGKIVYFRIPEKVNFQQGKKFEKDMLIEKMDIKKNSEFSQWISNELFDRFNYVCCDSIDQFQRETKAITINGQIKGNRGRHEKDDGRDLHDQRYYILGWNNQEKIRSIQQEIEILDKRIKENNELSTSIKTKKDFLEKQKYSIYDLLKFENYSTIDWKEDAEEIQKYKQQIAELKKNSDLLTTLKTKLESIQTEIRNLEGENNKLQNKMGEIKNIIFENEQDLVHCRKIVGESPGISDDLLPIITGVISDEKFELKTINLRQENANKLLTKTLEEDSSYARKSSNNIVTMMEKFKQAFPDVTLEMVAIIEAIPEYQKIYEKIKTEDLPQYEKRFKELLKEGTIQDIAMFNSELENHAKQIQKNLKMINESLRAIEYSLGTYIELSAIKNPDVDISDFKIQLRNCFEGTIGEKNAYTEDKFNQVKKILDRFNSGNIADVNWTNKVTDVRYWYSFSASERFADNGAEKDFYSDSSGKSGGQKEKLAYTILASALAYQFGSAGNNPQSKSFRFVMIDEAFGRGSDESTRYGLDLFKKLDLQLLIITPYQKIHIIENYINCVHLVSNESGSYSMIRDIPIQEYLENKNNLENSRLI